MAGIRRWARILLFVVLLAPGLPLSVRADEPITPQRAATIAHSGTFVGRTNPARAVTLAVPLKPAKQANLDAFLADLYNPASPNYKHYLTPQQFTQRFFDAAARKQVVAYLQQQGFAVNDPGVGAVIDATGTAAQAERAFKVTLTDYRDAAGRVYYVNDVTPAIPVSIDRVIDGILGLDTVPLARHAGGHAPNTVTAPAAPPGTIGTSMAPCAPATTVATANGTLLPAQFGAAYNMDALNAAGFHGEGQTIALFEASDYRDADIFVYQTCLGTSGTTVFQRILMDGGPLVGHQYDGEGEVAGDIEEVIGAAPELANVLVYEIPNQRASIVNQYQKIANDNLAPVVSSSWFYCEQYTTVAQQNGENTAFQQMAAQGQTMLAISGDWGSASCYIFGGIYGDALAQADPGSQPYVTSVGGTRLTVNGSNQWSNEVVWNDYPNPNGCCGSGGGGVSILWPQPAYQTGPGTVNAALNPNRMRAVPDVTAAGDLQFTFYVYDLGSWGAYYGTSFGTPLWAAGITLVNQHLLAHGRARMGFANPALYQIFNTAQYAAVFHDITSGNNCWDVSSPCGTPNTAGSKYTSAANFDFASGIGAPNFGNLATVIEGPSALPVARTSPTGASHPNPLPSPAAPPGPPQVSTPNPLPVRR